MPARASHFYVCWTYGRKDKGRRLSKTGQRWLGRREALVSSTAPWLNRFERDFTGTALLPGSKLTQGTDHHRAFVVPASAPDMRLPRSPRQRRPASGRGKTGGREAHAPPGAGFRRNPAAVPLGPPMSFVLWSQVFRGTWSRFETNRKAQYLISLLSYFNFISSPQGDAHHSAYTPHPPELVKF